ncbi:heptose-I-phosphate ethanolaminephosphotransferase [Flavobacteriaceae bacterium MAR_2010_72]|nr:heptose-I-phosphate ethanolaminephosphotransferase [Flavobacteriaceae bacterium MAR_2010_72]TVZ59003.1 heptose-I-phosphate ethanolaminephosphotransferase [Flavobacteriaceae bacterium MAR_2010_105]
MLNFKTIKYLFLIFGLPILLAFLSEIIFKIVAIARVCNFIENILFALILVLLVSMVSNKSTRKVLLIFGALIFNICLLFETFYFLKFNSTLSASSIFVVLESNEVEIREFLSLHFDLKTKLLTIFLLTMIFVGILKIVNKPRFNLDAAKDKSLKVDTIILGLLFLKYTQLIVFNVPYLILKTPITYIQEMKKFESYGSNNKYSDFKNVKHNDTLNKNELYVIVIGESTNRKHFSLNHNYYRETTPQLNEIKNELYVFNQVISSHTYTLGALPKALTLGNYEYPEGKYKGSIVQLFNQANFKTYWISNQKPIGMMDTQITKIGMGAHKSFFLNANHAKESTPYDNLVLSTMDDVLHEEGNKKVVFLHILGTHLNYRNRFPKKDEYFKDKPKTQFKTEIAYNTINDYDNAVRYQDKILRQIIEKVKVIPSFSSYVLYFSDHGQEVYDDINFSGHTIDEQITRNMYEVPMFVWLSNKYCLKTSLDFRVNSKYMTDDLFHAIADLSNISSNETDSTRSIFNVAFKERKRIIKDTIDYDAYFN